MKNSYKWVSRHILGLFVFNLIITILVLLHGAGYFHPFFVITINFIVFVGLILSIFLLGANSKTLFLISLIFWISTTFFKLAQVDVWAERSSVYTFQAFFVGVLLLIIESVRLNIKRVGIYLSSVKKFFLRSKQ